MNEDMRLQISRPEELVFRSFFAPVDVAAMLESSETRSKIRRLPVPQLYYGIRGLSEGQMIELLPHLTEEQWTGVLDLDLWDRDEVDSGRFLFWHRAIDRVEAPVTRKLLRAGDDELWQMALDEHVTIYRRVDDEYEGQPAPGREWFETPDQSYLIALPRDAELALLVRRIILRLYEVDVERAITWMEMWRFRTLTELEETAYRLRKDRVEDLGFLDYFDALPLYSPLDIDAALPEKDWQGIPQLENLPARLPAAEEQGLLLFQALTSVESATERQSLSEELIYVSNKTLSADRLSPAEPERMRRAIRKAVTGINLGLDCWSRGDAARAGLGVRRHFLESFFQIGYGRLLEVQRAARILAKRGVSTEPGSLDEMAIEGFLRPYPLRTVRTRAGKAGRRFFRVRRDLAMAARILSRLGGELSKPASDSG